MPSFDVVSEVDNHELNNAIDQVNREISTRFDFKGSDAKVELSGDEIKMEVEMIEKHGDQLINKLRNAV